jgi:hypothetical protein
MGPLGGSLSPGALAPHAATTVPAPALPAPVPAPVAAAGSPTTVDAIAAELAASKQARLKIEGELVQLGQQLEFAIANDPAGRVRAAAPVQVRSWEGGGVLCRAGRER